MLNPFTPDGTVLINATTSSSRVALPTSLGNQLRIAGVAANALAFFKTGDSAVVAATTDTPIVPGTAEIWTIPPSHTHVAAITGASTAQLFFTRGDGQ